MSDRTPIVSISDSNQGHEGQNSSCSIRTVDVTFFFWFDSLKYSCTSLSREQKRNNNNNNREIKRKKDEHV
jgi:hypothetical protein